MLYAALTGGDVCACTNTTPAAASRYGDGRCFEPCKGDFALKCGGTNYYSVYEVRGKFNFDYELTIPSRVSPFTDFNATVTSYEGASTFFDFGEGLSYWTSTASIKYVYRSVGHFQVRYLTLLTLTFLKYRRFLYNVNVYTLSISRKEHPTLGTFLAVSSLSIYMISNIFTASFSVL